MARVYVPLIQVASYCYGDRCSRTDLSASVCDHCYEMLEHLDSINTYEFDSDTIRFSGEVLVVVFSVGLIPMVDDGSGSADIEPLAEIATLANNYAQKARRKTVRAVDIKKAVRDLEREGGE